MIVSIITCYQHCILYYCILYIIIIIIIIISIIILPGPEGSGRLATLDAAGSATRPRGHTPPLPALPL